MTRRQSFAAIAAVAGMAGVMPIQVKAEDTKMFNELLAASQKEKKGLNFYVKGQTIGGLVVKIDGDFVEVRNREFGRIVIRLASVDAIAMA